MDSDFRQFGESRRAGSNDEVTCREDVGFVIKEPPAVRIPERYVGYTYTSRPPCWKLTPALSGALDAALLFALQCRRLPLKAAQSLLGVLVWALLLRRHLLAVPSSSGPRGMASTGSAGTSGRS